MRIGSILENQNIEKRVAITPEIVKKYTSLGFEVFLTKEYGKHLGFNNEEYKNLGVTLLEGEDEIIKKSDIIVQLGLPDKEKLSLLKENQTLIGSLNTYLNEEKLKDLNSKKMGAVVFATDVRMASKEQVESLGGKFLTVEGSENLETEGGYAKEASEDFKKNKRNY